MRAEHVDAFISSAFDILGGQARTRPERGSPSLRGGETLSSRELTVLVGLAGELHGTAFYSMSLATAWKLVALLAGQHQSGTLNDENITEMAGKMAAAGLQRLEDSGCRCELEEARVVRGFGQFLTAEGPVLVVPLYTEYGDVDVGITLQPAAGQPLALAADEPPSQGAVA